jgi:hypothetical protein
MRDCTMAKQADAASAADFGNSQSGFGLVEILISALLLLSSSALVYGALSEVQHTTSYQTEVQSVLNNTRLAMQTIGRSIRQAGNDPLGSGLAAITIVSPTELKIQSDLTGSLGPASPDKGDPDGDTNDSNENVTIRYNSATRSIEIVPNNGPAQIIAGYVSGLSFQYYDSGGSPTAIGSAVRKINVMITGASLLPDPQTQQVFGMQLSSDFQVVP